MPDTSQNIISYWPSLFILPFLFITLYFIIKEPVTWKFLPLVWLSLFIIVLSHTGSFLFLFSFLIVFFSLYCLLWGKFLKPLYSVILSILIIYVITLKSFPEIAFQYKVKGTLFLMPGDFLAKKFNFLLPGDLGRILYQNLIVEQQFIYVIILGASLFAIGELLVYVNRKLTTFVSKSENFYAFALPIQNISHSLVASPFWLGPVQVMLSVVGVFHLNNKGKCLLITALLTVILPPLLQNLQGIFVSTGALREISFLVIIIPITATLGFWHILDYLHNPPSKIKTRVSSVLWVVVCLAIIIPPILGTTYYYPTIAGEDYTIGGMKWLGENGDHTEKVVGYSLRTVPIYTNMVDASYDVQMGPESTRFENFIKNIYFGYGDPIKQVKDFRRYFGVKYIISSDKIVRNMRGTQDELLIDSNPALNKIYASNDFGAYEVNTLSENPVPESYLAENISLKQRGGSYEIESDFYKVILSESAPVLKRFGPSQQNLLGNGFFKEKLWISGTELSEGDQFNLDEMEYSHEITGNQITYRTILHNPQHLEPEGTLIVRYTFYSNVIKREYIFSNDWLITKNSPQINIQYSISIYSPMSQFVVENEKTRLERHIYPSEDAITKNVYIEDFYLNDGKNGMYITFAAQSPQPSSIIYEGSTNYNLSSVGITQSSSIKPGASFFSTQFLSLGSESDAKKNIQTRKGIELINYPDGITPILLAGYRTPQSDRNNNEKITTGYTVLKNNSIPYSEIINPSVRIENITDQQNITSPKVLLINLEELSNNNITIIGSQKTGATYYDDHTTQETNINILTDYTKKQGVSYTGFMPDSFNYNLDTLTILFENKIPFLFSSQINPTTKGYRNPQMAYYKNEPTGLVLFPVSSPISSSLLSNPRKEDIFSSWRATIDTAANNDEMALFLLRSQDIGDPLYSEDFVQLFSYARERGLTFSSPTTIAEHFKQLQNIRYAGIIDGDEAIINVTNANPVLVRNVTFKVTLPTLKNGNYRVNDGDIVRIKREIGQSILYISIEIPADSTKKIIVEPDVVRKPFHIEIPQQPIIEGSSVITVKDEADQPLSGVDVIVDSAYHQTDANGAVRVDLGRGYHMITIQSPGYEKYSSVIDVKGRIFIIEQIIGNIF